ncbi:MAG TPA: O-antigen ligase family protein [Patescibacteria group bacterium]|nr:O-antigen ligase family protein [Patescibacteria group bacterium]
MFQKASRVLFFLIVFCLPFQVGYHFWPDFSYVYGVRVDYLSPTLYLLDLFIILLFVFFILGLFFDKERIKIYPKNKYTLILIFLLGASLLINYISAHAPQAHMFGIVKLFEFSFLGLWIANYFERRDIPYFIDSLALSSIVSSVLAIWQFNNQSSVGGLWYYLGERTYNPLTIGIAKFSIDGDVLRSYGAFPHPNLLAFFLLISIVFIFLNLGQEKNRYEKLLLIFASIVSSVALLLTFSRVIIVLYLAFTILLICKKFKKYILYFFPILIILTLYMTIYHARFMTPEFLLRDSDFRLELISESFTILKNNLYFGTGLNNYFYYQVPLVKTITPTLYQPVHNIFLYWFLETGIFGFLLLPLVFFKAIKELVLKLKKKLEVGFNQGILFLLIAIIVTGMTDHFFLTLEQGQIMLVLIFGLSFVIFFPKRLSKRKSKR